MNENKELETADKKEQNTLVYKNECELVAFNYIDSLAIIGDLNRKIISNKLIESNILIEINDEIEVIESIKYYKGEKTFKNSMSVDNNNAFIAELKAIKVFEENDINETFFKHIKTLEDCRFENINRNYSVIKQNPKFVLFTFGCSNCEKQGKVKCSSCNSNGSLTCNNCRGSGQTACENCNASGSVLEDYYVKVGDTEERQKRSIPCDNCAGAGKIRCNGCDGTGRCICNECRGKGIVNCSNCGSTGFITKAGQICVQSSVDSKIVRFDDHDKFVINTFENIEEKPHLLSDLLTYEYDSHKIFDSNKLIITYNATFKHCDIIIGLLGKEFLFKIFKTTPELFDDGGFKQYSVIYVGNKIFDDLLEFKAYPKSDSVVDAVALIKKFVESDLHENLLAEYSKNTDLETIANNLNNVIDKTYIDKSVAKINEIANVINDFYISERCKFYYSICTVFVALLFAYMVFIAGNLNSLFGIYSIILIFIFALGIIIIKSATDNFTIELMRNIGGDNLAKIVKFKEGGFSFLISEIRRINKNKSEG